MKREVGIYIHIPFCEQKCIYCSFSSFVCEEREAYFSALIKEIENAPDNLIAKSIYFGGGTPSIVATNQIERVMNAIRAKLKIKNDAEITIECNPNSAPLEKLCAYKKMGFNRVSFGVQALQTETLKFLGRLHTKEQALLAIKNAKKAGFCNISADLMLGLPKQKWQDVRYSAKGLIESGVMHISAYTLQVEEGTPLFAKVQAGGLVLPSDDETADMYEKLCQFLEKEGFLRYEVSNFAKLGFESRHNTLYWQREEYLGFGLSAHSFFGEKRFANSSKMKEYIMGKGRIEESLSKRDNCTEIIMLGLRCRHGFSIKELEKNGLLIKDNPKFKQLLEREILFLEQDVVKLNPKYYEVSNSVICELLD